MKFTRAEIDASALAQRELAKNRRAIAALQQTQPKARPVI